MAWSTKSIPVLWIALLGWAPVAFAAPPGAADPDAMPEAFRVATGALMSPWATRAFQVTPSGDLFDGETWLRLRPTADDVPADAPRVVAAEDRWLPVLHWRRRSGDLVWDFDAVALPAPGVGGFDPRGWLTAWRVDADRRAERERIDAALAGYPDTRRDSLLVRVRRAFERRIEDRRGVIVTIEARVRNTGARARRVRLDATLERRGPDAPFFAPDTFAWAPRSLAWAGDGDSAIAIRPDAAADAPASLAPGASRSFRVVVTSYPVASRTLVAWTRTPHAERVAQARRFWTREVARGARFELRDPEVERAMAAARVTLLALRERRGTMAVPIGGPFHYRDVWVRDGARAIQALALAGYDREARELLPALLEFQWSHGPFISQTGQLDGTGQALWVFDEVLARSPSGDRNRYAAAAARAVAYTERVRSRTVSSERLLPVTQPFDNELVRARLVGNDAWSIAGYRAAAGLLRRAGRTGDAERVEAALADYLRDFGHAASRVSGPDLPPAWDGRGNDWGNLAVGYPCRALPADHPRLVSLAHRYFAAGENVGGGFYGSPELRHGYVGADLGSWALLAGDPALADSVLTSLLAWRTASGGIPETFVRSTRDYEKNFPPHPTAAAALLVLVRNSLLCDEGDTLRLTLGARTAWWQGARVSAAPTRWGALDLAFERSGDHARWQWTPKPVWTVLRLPPGTVLAESPGDGVEGVPGDRVVRVPPGCARVEVAIRDV